MILIQKLKRLAGMGPTDENAAVTAFQAVSEELASVQREFSELEAAFGDRLLAAMADGNAHEVENELAAKRREVERLERARAAIQGRVQAAQEAAGRREDAKRWDALAVKLRARTEALAKFERAMSEAGAALVAAEAAALEAWQALPARTGAGGKYVPHGLVPHYTDLSGEYRAQMSLATDGRAGGVVGSSLWELRKAPGLTERADRDAAYWLSLRPADLEASEPPPEAA